jgi:L-asparaginase
MKPYSIDSVEAVSNLMLSIGFLKGTTNTGIYIGMHGFIKDHKEIKKNRELGVFECHK